MPLPSQVGQLSVGEPITLRTDLDVTGSGCQPQSAHGLLPTLSFARIWVSTPSSVTYLPAHVSICMYMDVYNCILHVYAHIYNYMHVYSSIHMYMYVYVCICMYNSEMDCKMPKYKKQYMQIYSCICMYMYVNICICMNMQLYV